MRTVRHQRGYAMVMAMLLLAIGAIMTAWVYSMLSTATAVARNNTAQSRAMMAAESGLAYVTAKIKRVTNDAANPITATSEAEALHNVAVALKARWSVTGSELVVSEDPAHPHAIANAIALSESCSFDLDLRPNNRADSDYTLRVTGHYGSIYRVIGLHLSKGLPDMPGWMNYPLISKGPMGIETGAVSIYRWDPDRYPGAPVTGGADRSDIGEPVDYGDGNALRFRDSPPVENPSFPAKYAKSDLYTKLEAMRSSNALTEFAYPKDRKGDDIRNPVSSLTNTFIPAGKNVELTANATLNGIIYVEWPNSLTFGNNVTFNGVIVYTQPSASALANQPANKWPTIHVENTINMTCDSAQTDRSVLEAFAGACGSSAEAQNYANMLWPWTVLAPDTDWNMAEGDTTGDFQFTGNIHIRNLEKAAGAGTLSPDKYCYHGVILCEGEVVLHGNREFSFDPPNPEDLRNHLPNGVALDVAHGGYWEE